jgi:hypothetical protein
MALEPNGVNPKQPSMVQGITAAVRYYTNRCRVQRTSKLVQKHKQHSEFSSNLELNSMSTYIKVAEICFTWKFSTAVLIFFENKFRTALQKTDDTINNKAP